MFSTGQWIFVIFFVIAFVIFLIISYKKDKKVHQKHYKGSFWILIGFIAFVGILLALKLWLKP
ncbi:MAG: Ca2+/Na+ antiporter [Flavobacteriaceae bacterium]|jgi:Ca2+/Na+ antiporter